ncbi:MAG TPA: hypothetical protein VFR25_05840 [Candidatus Eisenbacteria bacterium]|nr:hypothetical protein [Candidatus Eisenbacteria bacterium]
MRRFMVLTGLAAAVLGLLYLTGCGDKVTPPPPHQDTNPETELTYAPLPGDTTAFRVHFYWNGYDKDGEVISFSFAVDADTLKDPKDWPTTTSKDTTLLFLVDPVREVRQHVFKVAARDNDGQWDQSPAFRFFSAKTLPPTSLIKRGPAAFNPIVGPNFTFEWEGIDPDGSETGGKTPVDSFEYVLLLIGATGAPDADVLPQYNQDFYLNLVNQSTGPTLKSDFEGLGRIWNFSDWHWIGIHSLKNRFRNATPGEYVFAERAVDVAGATEKDLGFGTNFRHFTVSTKNPGPSLIISSSVLTLPLPAAVGPGDTPRKPLQIFEGETISFSWTASADAYGGEIVGYTYALDDTSTFPGLDLLRTGATFRPAQLPPGNHFLFVRAVDDGGLITNAVIPMKIVHPDFKDPGHPHSIAYVDDSTPPGVTIDRTQAIGNFPRDLDEDRFWESDPGILVGLAPFNQWDASDNGYGEVEGRKPPDPDWLKDYSTVIWNVDFNNGVGNPTGLWRTLVGGAYSELAGYLRAGGTMILSGFLIGGNVINPNTVLYGNVSRGICFALEPGTTEYFLGTFPRMFMGVDGAVLGGPDLRTLGGKDFIQARPTPAGIAMGFDTVDVDRGPLGSGAKWITYSGFGSLNENLAPGLLYVDGLVMARNFACVDQPNSVFRLEDPTTPIAAPIYTYHGVHSGINEEGGPSPREGRVVGIRTQAHDLGTEGAGTITRGNAAGAIGRIVHLAFPLYFMKTEQARQLLQTSFNYVDQSPTLP